MKRLTTILAVTLLCACSDDPGLRETYALVSVDGAALPFEMAAGGSVQSFALLEAYLTVLPGEVRTRELIRVVTDGGETTEQWHEWTTPYATDWSRLVLEPVDPASAGICLVGPVFGIEDDGRRLRTVGTTYVGDCDDLPIVGPEPFERVYESID